MKIPFWILIILANFIDKILSIDNCYFYEGQYNCGSNVGDFNSRCFQAPTKGGTADPEYRDTYQGMLYIVGYARQIYNSDKTQCTVSIITRVNNYETQNNDYEYVYTIHDYNYYDNSHQTVGATRTFNKADNLYEEGITTSVLIRRNNDKSEVAKVEFEKLYFIWNLLEMKYDKEFNEKDQVGVIVELFGWPYEDIIEENDFIKLSGYLGVKITPQMIMSRPRIGYKATASIHGNISFRQSLIS